VLLLGMCGGGSLAFGGVLGGLGEVGPVVCVRLLNRFSRS